MAQNALELIETMKDIPAMPTVIVKALGIIKNDQSGTKELSEIMAYDQALTSQVLKLVNSAYYGFAQEITSINKALALLGMNQTRNIIIAVAMKPMLTSQGGRDMWKHSLKAGVACEYLANETDSADAGDAFTIGFLHDIGKIILNIFDTMTYQKVKLDVTNGMDIIEAEEEAFGTNHADIGFQLAKKWKLSVLLANCIKYHHDPLASSMPKVSCLTHIGDQLAQESPELPEIDPEILENFGVSMDTLNSYREVIEEKTNALFMSLKA